MKKGIKIIIAIIKKIVLIEIVGFAIIYSFFFLTEKLGLYKDHSFGDGTYYLYQWEDFDDSKITGYALRNNYESTVMLYKVHSYYENKQEKLIYAIGNRTDQLTEAYVIIDSKKNNYRIYNTLLEVPEQQRSIFSNSKLFTKT